MIITRLRLNPFAGQSDRELKFGGNLNVILGPNEAGKTTIFHAIQKVLFVPAKLGKRKFEGEIKDFLPIGGGDTIHVELDFSHEGSRFRLSRSWGATKSSKLILPDGSIVTDDRSITEKLSPVLKATEGTYRSVLHTYQTGLSRTIEELVERSPDTVHSLGDIIRKTVLETDGVSVDRFRDRVGDLYKEYFSRWDRNLELPEKGRGITRPYLKEVGLILEAYYRKENIRATLDAAREFEDRLDELNRKITECADILEEKETYIDENRKTVDDVRERKGLETELEKLDNRMERYQKDNAAWPVTESRLKEINRKLPGLIEQKQALEKEKRDAERGEEIVNLRKKFEMVRKKQKALEEAQTKLDGLLQVTESVMNRIRGVSSEVERLRAVITASKLSGRFDTKKDISITVREGFDPARRLGLKKCESFTIDAEGQLVIEHSDWTVRVRSGGEEFKKTLDNLEVAEKTLETLFSECGVTDIEEARKAAEIHRSHLEQKNSVASQLEDELGDETIEELTRRMEETGAVKETRTQAVIVEELVNTDRDIRELTGKAGEYSTEIKTLSEKYETKDKLLLDLAGIVQRRQVVINRLQNIIPLPDAVDDIDSYIELYEKEVRARDVEKNRKGKLLVDHAGLEGEAPDESVEEQERNLREAEERFETVKRTGNAVARIHDLTLSLLEGLDGDTYGGLEADLEGYVSEMTDGKYSDVSMEESLPRGFVREDGILIPTDLLSTGTKDVLALALRLSMARHFLSDSDGFLVLDDPLIDLDPERQARAARILRVFAGDRQTLIFTCFPTHADLLGGNLIRL